MVHKCNMANIIHHIIVMHNLKLDPNPDTVPNGSTYSV